MMDVVKKPLSVTLLQVVFSIYLFIAIVITSLHIYIAYDDARAHVKKQLESIEEAFGPAFFTAIWELNDEQLSSLSRGILELNYVKGLIITDDMGSVLFTSEGAYDTSVSDTFSYQFPIFSRSSNNAVRLASIQLFSNSSVVVDRIYIGVVVLIINAIIKTIILWLLLLWAFKKYIFRPLNKFVLALQDVDLNQSEIEPIDLETRDESELKLIERSFNQMTNTIHSQKSELVVKNQKLIKASKSKDEFLANMSHEVRTPLNAVLGMANIGVRDTTDSRSRETFNHILDASQHLLTIVNDILDFSKLEAGELLIESRPFQLIATVEDAINMVANRARDKGLKLSVDLQGNLPAWVLGDPFRLQQILLNLLSNAIKFTDKGEVLVSLTRDKDETCFTVKDTGIGLDEKQISKLFTPFEQADTSTTRDFGGTGLGLTISYNLARLMDGDINVEGRINEGSVFILSLPLVEAKSPDLEIPEAAEVSEPQLKDMRVLVAEDVEINRIIIEDILEQEGATVTFAENGQQAIDCIDQIGPDNIDVILMDIQMPVMDGYEATRRILEIAPDLPIIGVTAHALLEERNKCLDAGMLDHVTKPIVVNQLIASIKSHVLS